MADIKRNYEEVSNSIKEAAVNAGRPEDSVLLCAVTKTHTADEINEAIDAGATDIGENRVQEIMDKYDHVKPVRWHMIGHLQTNKVKYIIDKVCLIHSVDTLRLAEEIDRRAGEHGITMDILVQVNPAMEETKSGASTEETEGLLKSILETCPNIRVRGLMTIAPYAEDPEEIRQYFREVKGLYDSFASIEHENLDLAYLSMGMSNDYKVAIEEGANIVRIGTAIFGARDYGNL